MKLRKELEKAKKILEENDFVVKAKAYFCIECGTLIEKGKEYCNPCVKEMKETKKREEEEKISKATAKIDKEFLEICDKLVEKFKTQDLILVITWKGNAIKLEISDHYYENERYNIRVLEDKLRQKFLSFKKTYIPHVNKHVSHSAITTDFYVIYERRLEE